MPKKSQTDLAAAMRTMEKPGPAMPPDGSQAAPASTAPKSRGREGTRIVSGHFASPVHRQLRLIAVQEDRTLQDLLTEAINDLFAKRGIPPVA